jgi:Tol biopolymer transport system component
VIGGKELGSELNVGPSLSPDGQWIAFLSTRTLFSTDVYIAEAATGRIVRKLTSTATDPHFSEHSVHLLGRSVGQQQAASSRSPR